MIFFLKNTPLINFWQKKKKWECMNNKSIHILENIKIRNFAMKHIAKSQLIEHFVIRLSLILPAILEGSIVNLPKCVIFVQNDVISWKSFFVVNSSFDQKNTKSSPFEIEMQFPNVLKFSSWKKNQRNVSKLTLCCFHFQKCFIVNS